MLGRVIGGEGGVIITEKFRPFVGKTLMQWDLSDRDKKIGAIFIRLNRR